MGNFSFQVLSLTSLFFTMSGWRVNSALYAQIVPDPTLPTNSLVTTEGNIFTINGGTTAGSNLFHSFQQFSLPTGNTAFFNNLSNINNIITRVTGGQISNIDGLIRANGNANLFLINPNGIIFGTNARLDIGGSFIGSTANSIKFGDGSEFSATNPQNSTLLSINVPIGLQLGPNPGNIRVSGSGHNLELNSDRDPPPLQIGSENRGLEVKAGHTLALIGGQIALDGGILTAERGRIELGSVNQAQVNLNPTSFGWTFSYPQVQNYGDIQLSKAALLNADGGGGSGIQIVGKQVRMNEGSFAFTNTVDALPGGAIAVSASDLVELSGESESVQSIPSSLTSQSVAQGNGGNILISTNRLLITNGGRIDSIAFGAGNGGSITILANDFVKFLEPSRFNINNFSGTESLNLGSGNGGDVNISTSHLEIMNGGALSAITRANGRGGNVDLKVTYSLEVVGFNNVTPTANPFRSAIIAQSIGSGDAGNLTIDTSRLIVRDGARIGASTIANGKGGNLIVNASESIEVSGVGTGTSLNSLLSSSALSNTPSQRFYGLPLIPAGDAGTATINTPKLIVSNQGLVGVDNQGYGNAGDLRITAGQIILDRGNITAASRFGGGGNMNLQIGEYVLLRNNSQITAQAGANGNGGNMTINSPFVVAIKHQNNDIIANAATGNGGRINITAKGIFGLVQTRGSLNDFASEINASSEFGISGNVTINSPDINPTSGLVKLKAEENDTSTLLGVGCAATRDNSFTIIGRRGLPVNPTDYLSGQIFWYDWRLVPQSGERETPEHGRMGKRERQAISNNNDQSSIVEVQGWQINRQGQVELVTHPNSIITSNTGNIIPSCAMQRYP